MEKAAPRSRRKALPYDERFVKDKNEKRRLKREAFLLKLEEAKDKRAEANNKNGNEAPDEKDITMGDLSRGLPLTWNEDEDGDGDKNRQPDKAAGKKKKVPLNLAQNHFKRVYEHEAFQANPLAALDEHLGNCFETGLLK